MKAMTQVWLMAAGSGVVWLVANLSTPDASVALLLGMLAPLAMVTTSLLLIDRGYRREPSRLTSLMIKAFMGKLVFVGAYVTLMMGVLSVPAVPFIASFTGSFIALYLAEALCLRRLLAAGAQAPDLTTS